MIIFINDKNTNPDLWSHNILLTNYIHVNPDKDSVFIMLERFDEDDLRLLKHSCEVNLNRLKKLSTEEIK